MNSAKLVEKKQAAQVVAAQKQAMAAEADAFRGVHLGPNVHHWDEVRVLSLRSDKYLTIAIRMRATTVTFWTRSLNSTTVVSIPFHRPSQNLHLRESPPGRENLQRSTTCQ